MKLFRAVLCVIGGEQARQKDFLTFLHRISFEIAACLPFLFPLSLSCALDGLWFPPFFRLLFTLRRLCCSFIPHAALFISHITIRSPS
ncbi:hypothetical protein VTN00DRAFT_943 [Thermoascus crustaceus]|uniref:uncharacterized protein n=1 Tax=Thermoascus crustaceus TaxID=5088 RepID=UPI0037438188